MTTLGFVSERKTGIKVYLWGYGRTPIGKGRNVMGMS